MLKKILVTLALVVTTTHVYASPISCSSLISTHWHDNKEKHFGQIQLSFDYQSGDPFSNNNFIHYTLGYSNGKFGDHFTHGQLQSIHCASQPHGYTQLTLSFDDGLTNLVLQSTDDQSFTVLTGSQISDNNHNAVAIHGPFLRG